jgi:phage terminase large subunit-like protein
VSAPSAPSAAELLTTSAGRRLLSAASPQFFDTYYCGMTRAAHRDRWLDTFEGTTRRAREGGVKGKMLILAPRDHGKTEVAISYATRALCLNRDVRILWISESQGQAEKRMRRISALLNSARILEDFTTAPAEGAGPFRDEGSKWTNNLIYLKRQRESVDASLECIGAGGAVTGGHFDLILCDDIQDDKNTFSAGQRSKTREWWKGTIAPMLSRGGSLIVIGTRKHHDDLFAHIMKDATYHVMHDQAIVEWPERYAYQREEAGGREIITGVEVEGGRALWPEQRPLDYLLLERHTIGARLFSREFQNEVQDDSAAPFKMAWLDAALERGAGLSLGQVPSEVIDIVQGWDFALVTDARAAEERDTDFSVGMTWGRAENGDRYLIDIWRRRGLSMAELHTHVKAQYARFGARVRVVAVEKNAFGELHYLGLQRSTDLPLKGHITHARNKADPWEGVPALSALFENGKVIIPSRTDTDRERVEPLIHELFSLGKERHDDCVMSLWIAETWLRKSSFTYSLSFGDGGEITGTSDERLAGGADDDLDTHEQIEARANERDSDRIWASLPGFGRH